MKKFGFLVITLFLFSFAVAGFAQVKSASGLEMIDSSDGSEGVLLSDATQIGNSCTDSDGGMSFFTKGFTYGVFNGSNYSYSDYCDGTSVREYYCSGSFLNYTGMNCKGYGDHYTCRDGACVYQEDTCTDTDNGLNYFQKGSIYGVFNGNNFFNNTDFCLSQFLMEFYCNGTKPSYVQTDCTQRTDDNVYTCSDGACVPTSQNITNTCADTDGGLNYYTKGNVFGFLNTISYNNEDFCISNFLREYYCNGSYQFSTVIDCSLSSHNGHTDYCSDGACTIAAPPTDYTCSDSDGGQNIFAKGFTSGLYKGVNYTSTDYCTYDTSIVFEYSCFGEWGEFSQGAMLHCPNGTACSNGACVSQPLMQPNCTDSDPANSLFVKGHVFGWVPSYDYDWWDSCYSDSTATNLKVAKTYCSDYHYPLQLIYDCPTGTACIDGVCVNSTPVQPVNTCNDTDGGFNIGTKGTVSGVMSGSPYSYTDWCDGTKTLREYYCNGPYYNYTGKDCNFMGMTCIDGACKSSVNTFCGDWTVQKPNSAGQYEECDDPSPYCVSCIARGTPNGWVGCHGSGAHACSNKLTNPTAYFQAHPLCIILNDCTGLLMGSCNENYCPPENNSPMNNTPCMNTCNYGGQKKCEGNYSYTCGNYNNDLCSEWDSGTFCIDGCNSGYCLMVHVPDLMPTSLTFNPTNPLTGQLTTVTALIKNRGNYTTGKVTQAQLILTDPNGGTGMRFNSGIPALAPGRDYSFSITTHFQITGEYNAVLWADYTNLVIESNESNNMLQKTFLVGNQTNSLNRFITDLG